MADITNTTVVKSVTLMDAFFIGASKLSTEALWQYIPVEAVKGTSYISGLSKVGTALALNMWKPSGMVGQIKDYVQAGILMDGVEDIVVTTKVKFFDNKTNSNEDVGVSNFAYQY